MEIRQSNCDQYVEDQNVCYDFGKHFGEPKGQCASCGYIWYEHHLLALPEDERASAERIQNEKGLVII